MSMTFFFPEDETITRRETCTCEWEGKFNEHCTACQGFGQIHFVLHKHEFNLSNTNAYRLLRLMGIEPDYCGNIAASDAMLDRATNAVVQSIMANDWGMADRAQFLIRLLNAAKRKGVDAITYG
jgi:hypothetical protein